MESKTIETASPPRPSAGRIRTPDVPSTPLVSDVLRALPGNGARFVACAPGRLDILGGLSEYAGAMALSAPLSEHACVGVERRPGDEIQTRFVSPAGSGASSATTLPATRLYADQAGPATFNGTDASDSPAVRGVLGTLVELIHGGLLPRREGGLSIVVASNLIGLTDAGQEAALAAATAAAVTSACGVTVDASALALVCQRVLQGWLDCPAGLADAAAPLTGEPNAITAVRCDPLSLNGNARLPERATLVGIDCGTVDAKARQKYQQARTAAFMGRTLIDRIIQHDGANGLPWDGYLAHIGVDDYVARFRDRLPARLKGAEFLRLFGEIGDPLTRIEPKVLYKLRSRTEHHIYEHDRSCRFLELLAGSTSGADAGLLEAGETMYASHWSYGQRCGLGSVQTDGLVDILRKMEPACGILGARIAGRGCGGVVTVLLRKSDRAMESVQAAMQAFQARFEKVPTLLRGGRPGAMIAGVQRL